MKICDKCFARDGIAVGAVDNIIVGKDDIVFDLCETCKQETIAFISTPILKKKPGRPPKKKKYETQIAI